MRPEVPADLKTLDKAALLALSAALKAYIGETLPTNTALASAEQVAEAQWASDARKAIKVVQDERAALQALADEAAEEDEDEPVEPPVDTDPAEPPAPDVAEPPVAAAPPAPAPTVQVPVAAAHVPTSTGAPSVPAAASTTTSTLASMVAAAGLEGKDGDSAIESWAELSALMTQRGDTLGNYSGSERFAVARIKANYTADRTITEEVYSGGLAKFERSDEITAALCAPATPYYGLACDNTLRRPVFGSMGQFAAPRGKVSIPTSPTLSDIVNQNAGYGQWTFANDDDGSQKNCAVVACNSFNDFQLYGIWKCLTVKNLMALTYPELVEAYLNRLGAAQARMAEILLLEAMATATVAVAAPSLGYGAATSFTTLVMEYMALYQETQRWDISDGMEAWMPRWVLTALQVDLARRRTTNGDVQTIRSVAAVETMLRDAGMNPHWFIDTPSWAPSIPAVQTGGIMNRLPTTIPVILAKRGKFAVIDRGNLTIGVTGNNIYRDNSSNRSNTYTYFVESFEGLVNTDSCPAHLLRIPVCYNGIQVDDRMVDCTGIDEAGYQS